MEQHYGLHQLSEGPNLLEQRKMPSFELMLEMPEGVQIVTGTKQAIQDLVVLGMDYGFLIGAVTMAAVGLKVWRGK